MEFMNFEQYNELFKTLLQLGLTTSQEHFSIRYLGCTECYWGLLKIRGRTRNTSPGMPALMTLTHTLAAMIETMPVEDATRRLLEAMLVDVSNDLDNRMQHRLTKTQRTETKIMAVA